MIPYLILINALGLMLMHVDKSLARKKQWRIPERVLFLVAALGGSIGVLMGMYAFRHKTRKLRFQLGIPLILALQGLLTSWAVYAPK